MWRQLIDQLRQILTEAGEQLIHAQATLLAQCAQRIAPERTRQVLGRDLLVRASADPGLRDTAMPAFLQFLNDVGKTATQHASSCGTAQHTAQSAGEKVAQ